MSVINEKLDAGASLPRHMHEKPYITLVLNGNYTEAGDHGRFLVKPGDILMHGDFAAHADWISRNQDVKTLNIEVDEIPEFHAVGTSNSFDSIIRFAQYDTPQAAQELFTSFQAKPQQFTDWPDLLAEKIRNNPTKSIQHWCDTFELAPATVSRGFKRAFGVTVAQYRVAARTRGAYFDLNHASSSLSDLAYDWGFADQAHFSRAIRSLTGRTPSYWQQVKNIQDRKSACS